MPRQRSKKNQGLPKRWKVVNGVYYYQVLPGLDGNVRALFLCTLL